MTFCNMQNVIIIQTNVTIISAFCSTQKGVMLPVDTGTYIDINIAWIGKLLMYNIFG
jgi:hypothetical protein